MRPNLPLKGYESYSPIVEFLEMIRIEAAMVSLNLGD